jgi:hypothetical protein
MTATATSQDSTLKLSYAEYTTNEPLQSLITAVVDSICSQDSSDRGAWSVVIAKRIARGGLYSEQEVMREVGRMLRSGALYECCREIRNGTFTMIYVKAEGVSEQ